MARKKGTVVVTLELSFHRLPSSPNNFLPHAKYTHPLLRPSKFLSHYGISLMFSISISKSRPGVLCSSDAVPQVQLPESSSSWSELKRQMICSHTLNTQTQGPETDSGWSQQTFLFQTGGRGERAGTRPFNSEIEVDTCHQFLHDNKVLLL